MVFVREKLDNRILFVPGAFTIPSAGIWWGVDEIKSFKNQGFVGLKLWPHGAILSSRIPLIHEPLDEAGRQGMPLIGYHTGDPGNAYSNSPAFPKFEDDSIDVARAHPQTTFIFAHGLFMLENDPGRDKLAGIFDKYPNVFVDLAFTHNMRQTAHYTVSKAREFYIKYRDRILFGSDVFAAEGGASGFLHERKVLETNQVTNGLHGGPKMEGLNLPDPVLNHLYYWNAARLIPRVRQVLEAQNFKIGYELGSFKCDRLPPEVTVNKLTVNGKVADLTGTGAFASPWRSAGILPAYRHRTVRTARAIPRAKPAECRRSARVPATRECAPCCDGTSWPATKGQWSGQWSVVSYRRWRRWTQPGGAGNPKS